MVVFESEAKAPVVRQTESHRTLDHAKLILEQILNTLFAILGPLRHVVDARNQGDVFAKAQRSRT